MVKFTWRRKNVFPATVPDADDPTGKRSWPILMTSRSSGGKMSLKLYPKFILLQSFEPVVESQVFVQHELPFSCWLSWYRLNVVSVPLSTGKYQKVVSRKKPWATHAHKITISVPDYSSILRLCYSKVTKWGNFLSSVCFEKRLLH